jgi:hypothetical protein
MKRRVIVPNRCHCGGDNRRTLPLEECPVVKVIPETGLVLDATKPGFTPLIRLPVYVARNFLREWPGCDAANGSSIKLRNAVVDQSRREDNVKVGQRSSRPNVCEVAFQGGLTDTALVEEGPRYDPRWKRLVFARALDCHHTSDDGWVGPESREHLDEAPLQFSASVDDPVHALRIVPAISECAIGSGVFPWRPSPRVWTSADSKEATGGTSDIQSGDHPPITKARAASTMSGPTSPSSPSRNRRAGDRSLSCGFKP